MERQCIDGIVDVHISCAGFLSETWTFPFRTHCFLMFCHLTKFFVRQLVFVGHFEGIESKGVLQVRFFR